MKYPEPLIRGSLVRRYKRFLSDIKLENGETVVAHCANSGSMLSVDASGSEVWLSPSNNPKRKLKYTWELIRVGETLVGINTQHPNGIVADAIEDGTIAELKGYETLRREVRYGENSRIDILLEGPGLPKCYVEVKNVTMRRGRGLNDPAEFPDAITKRGTKHLEELSRMVEEGCRSVMVYLVQREDCQSFTTAGDIDPVYASTLQSAMKKGVEALCYDCRVSTEGVRVAGPVKLNISGTGDGSR